MLSTLAGAAVWPSLARAQAGDPRQTVSELYAGLQVIMRMGAGASFQQKFDRLAPVIDKVINLPAILQTSVGPRWASLGQPVQQSLFAVFRTYTIASYTANFGGGGSTKFEVLPQTRASGTDQIVESRLVPSDGDPVRIDYVERSGAAGWQIVDVLLNGSISRVAVQRSDFRALLASGSATPLIDSLRKKVADLSDGAMRP